MSLVDELKNDPLNLGYAAHMPGDPQRVIDLLMAPNYTKLWPITAGQALTWAAAGPLAAITDASSNTSSPLRSSCLAFLLAMKAGRDVDMGDAKVKAQFDTWLSMNLIQQGDHDSIIALATGPASRADILGIPAPSARNIIDAFGA